VGHLLGERIALGPHLGKPNDIHLGNAKFLKDRDRNTQLSFATIDHQEVW
jgi:hypothetical protein